MARLTKEQVEEMVTNYIRQKYPNAQQMAFIDMEFKERFYEYWITASFKIDDGKVKQIFCRIDAGTGHLSHGIDEV